MVSKLYTRKLSIIEKEIRILFIGIKFLFKKASNIS